MRCIRLYTHSRPLEQSLPSSPLCAFATPHPTTLPTPLLTPPHPSSPTSHDVLAITICALYTCVRPRVPPRVRVRLVLVWKYAPLWGLPSMPRTSRLTAWIAPEHAAIHNGIAVTTPPLTYAAVACDAFSCDSNAALAIFVSISTATPTTISNSTAIASPADASTPTVLPTAVAATDVTPSFATSAPTFAAGVPVRWLVQSVDCTHTDPHRRLKPVCCHGAPHSLPPSAVYRVSRMHAPQCHSLQCHGCDFGLACGPTLPPPPHPPPPMESAATVAAPVAPPPKLCADWCSQYTYAATRCFLAPPRFSATPSHDATTCPYNLYDPCMCAWFYDVRVLCDCACACLRAPICARPRPKTGARILCAVIATNARLPHPRNCHHQNYRYRRFPKRQAAQSLCFTLSPLLHRRQCRGSHRYCYQ